MLVVNSAVVKGGDAVFEGGDAEGGGGHNDCRWFWRKECVPCRCLIIDFFYYY